MKGLERIKPSIVNLLLHWQWHGEGPKPSLEKADVPELMEWAKEHDYELISQALAHGRGQDFDLKELRREFDKAVNGGKYIRDEYRCKVTTPVVREREIAIAVAAYAGMGEYEPFNERPRVASAFSGGSVALPGWSVALSEEQRQATTKILQSRDFITLFQGGAGTGKSYTLRAVVRGLYEEGHRVVVVAPQHEQVEALRKDGLEASTLASKLGGQLRAIPHGSVVILDEAGQVGGKDMLALIERVEMKGGRLILSGDTRQHGAVAASDALRVIEEHTPCG
jgi:hypothetical protein